MNTKKESLIFVIKLSIYCFAFLMVASYVFLTLCHIEFIRVEYIGQVLFMIFFVGIGIIIGLTDLVFKIRSSKIRGIGAAVIFYIISLILFSFVSFNPFESVILLLAYTAFYFLGAFIVSLVFKYIQEMDSKKYDKYIKLLKETHTND